MLKWKTVWQDGKEITPELRKQLSESRAVLEKLTSILESKLKANQTAQLSKTNYDKTSWALEQADFIGTQRTLNELISIITPTIVNKD